MVLSPRDSWRKRATRALQEAAERLASNTRELADEAYVDFDHFNVSRVEPGKLWLDVWENGKAYPHGPIPVPRTVTRVLREGWDVSCSLARVRGTGHIRRDGQRVSDVTGPSAPRVRGTVPGLRPDLIERATNPF